MHLREVTVSNVRLKRGACRLEIGGHCFPLVLRHGPAIAETGGGEGGHLFCAEALERRGQGEVRGVCVCVCDMCVCDMCVTCVCVT